LSAKKIARHQYQTSVDVAHAQPSLRRSQAVARVIGRKGHASFRSLGLLT
jgi:hypothetical protein